MAIRIEPLHSDEQYTELELVQKQVWGMEDIDVVPKHILISINAHGGLVLGAYDDENRMVGILFGVPAVKDGRVYHYSHQCGVLPDRRFQGVGYQLKLRQREHVLNQGMDLVVWTYDPLEGSNAHFNLSKLGAICSTYKRNYYGSMRDSLNIGLETDRFQVEWWIRSKRVADRIEGRSVSPDLIELIGNGAIKVNRTAIPDDELLHPVSYTLDAGQALLLVEIPESSQRIKAASIELAKQWRQVTRTIFEHYFARGYVATELIRGALEGSQRNFDLLEKDFRVQ